MGYKPGQGIGKTQSGITEPIRVDVKANREGLGKTRKKYNGNVNAKLGDTDIRDFRSRLAQEKTEQLQKTDLYKSQKVCEKLDVEENVEEPEESWFWVEKEKDESLLSDSNVHSDHDNSDKNDKDDKNDEDDKTLSDLEKLDILTRYLRKKYFYCIWCGTKFDDEDDLRDNCPGSTRNDH